LPVSQALFPLPDSQAKKSKGTASIDKVFDVVRKETETTAAKRTIHMPFPAKCEVSPSMCLFLQNARFFKKEIKVLVAAAVQAPKGRPKPSLRNDRHQHKNRN